MEGLSRIRDEPGSDCSGTSGETEGTAELGLKSPRDTHAGFLGGEAGTS